MEIVVEEEDILVVKLLDQIAKRIHAYIESH